jgi:hypothetical protein
MTSIWQAISEHGIKAGQLTAAKRAQSVKNVVFEQAAKTGT